MPLDEKHIEFGTGTLFINGIELVGNVTASDIIGEDGIFVKDQPFIDFPLSQEVTFTATCDTTRLLQVACPNNWLKLHGYPMRRRRFK